MEEPTADDIIRTGLSLIKDHLDHLTHASQTDGEMMKMLQSKDLEDVYPAVIMGQGVILTTLAAFLRRVIKRMSQGMAMTEEEMLVALSQEYHLHIDEMGEQIDSMKSQSN